MDSTEHSASQFSPLSREEMEQLLPDYALGQLSNEERLDFERSLVQYPDLAEEAQDLRAAFETVEMKELRVERTQRTAGRLRNLSLHVQDRMAAHRERARKRRLVASWLVPTFAVCSAVAVVMLSDGRLTEMAGLFSASSQSELVSEGSMLRPDEATMLREDNAKRDGIIEADVSFKDALTVGVETAEAQDKESLLAAKMLRNETLAALSSEESLFGDRFAGESALLQDLRDGDLNDEEVAALLSKVSSNL